MQKIILFGVSPLTKEMKIYLDEDDRYQLAAFTAESDYIKEREFCGLPVLPFEELDSYYDMASIEILMTIAYSNMNKNRAVMFEKCHEKGYRIGTYIHPTVLNYADEIGEGNIILDRCVLRPFSRLGKGNIVLPNTIIAHEAKVGDYNYFAGSNHIGGFAQAGNYNFFGISCILESMHVIGNENLIGAGICLAKDIEDHIVVSAPPNRYKKATTRIMDIFLMKRGQ